MQVRIYKGMFVKKESLTDHLHLNSICILSLTRVRETPQGKISEFFPYIFLPLDSLETAF